MFSKKSEAAPRPSHASSVSGSTFSVLGADLCIKGDVTASTDLHIDGRIEGDIACATLVQGEASEIAGSVSARIARIAGTIRGSITAGDLVIQRSARIEGDVCYATLTIENGAVVEGRCPQSDAAMSVEEAAQGAPEPLLSLAV